MNRDLVNTPVHSILQRKCSLVILLKVVSDQLMVHLFDMFRTNGISKCRLSHCKNAVRLICISSMVSVFFDIIQITNGSG